MSVFMAATRNAPEPQAGSSRLKLGSTSWSRLLADRGVEVQQQVGQRVVLPHLDALGRVAADRLGRVDGLQDQPVDGPLAEVLGDLRPGVVGAERLLVDVLLEDVAQHVGVDLVVLAAGGVVEVPGVAGEQGEEVLECLVGHVELGIVLLDVVRQEQAAVEVLDRAESLSGLGRPLLFGLGEALEEQQLQEAAEEPVLAGLLALGQLVLKVVQVAAVEKALSFAGSR